MRAESGRRFVICAGVSLAVTAAVPSLAWAQVTVTVDPQADRRAISPLIYGVNWGNDQRFDQMGYTMRRWGGNAATRYNWQIDTTNRAFDWYFLNIEEPNPNPGALPDGSAADDFVEVTRNAGADVMMTVPLHMVAKPPRGRAAGFLVATYGPQCDQECVSLGGPCADNGECDPAVNHTGFCQSTGNPGGCGGPNGPPGLIVGNNPADTSISFTPQFVSNWVSHLVAREGTAAGGGVRFYNLDNEPMLWHSSHRDVHPAGATYDEVWAKGLSIATAIKAADPTAKVAGPETWGWCDIWSSGADLQDGQCFEGADRAAHGGIAWVPWYLQQICASPIAPGVLPVDYLDVHFYPQGDVAGIWSGDSGEDATTSARRLRSLKELYDPTYVSESWIGQQSATYNKPNLIPRLRAWRDQFCPQVKLALMEYKWGPDNGVSGALAQAEALAIFGREGLDIATRWVMPDSGTLAEDAFKLYLDYDGQGSQVMGDTARATSSNVNDVGAYAVMGAQTYVLLFNKATATRTVNVTVAGAASGTANLFRFDHPGQRLGPAGTVLVSGGGVLSLSLPERSATLAVLAPIDTTPLHFYSLTPCRVLDTRGNAPLGAEGALTNGEVRTLPIAGTGICGIPANAKALSLNLTVVPGVSGGSFALFPGPNPPPATSTLNFNAGRVRANNSVMGLSPTGTMGLRATLATGGSAHAILDVNGYFAQ